VHIGGVLVGLLKGAVGTATAIVMHSRASSEASCQPGVNTVLEGRWLTHPAKQTHLLGLEVPVGALMVIQQLDEAVPRVRQAHHLPALRAHRQGGVDQTAPCTSVTVLAAWSCVRWQGACAQQEAVYRECCAVPNMMMCVRTMARCSHLSGVPGHLRCGGSHCRSAAQQHYSCVSCQIPRDASLCRRHISCRGWNLQNLAAKQDHAQQRATCWELHTAPGAAHMHSAEVQSQHVDSQSFLWPSVT
jgi:hypothetical protein